jgi:hypothetical protein
MVGSLGAPLRYESHLCVTGNMHKTLCEVLLLINGSKHVFVPSRAGRT